VLAPDAPGCPAQFIDVRDLADWIVRMAEARTTGVYNATGPAAPYTLGELLDTCRDVSGSDAQFIWVSEPFLQEHEVGAFVELPQWTPAEASGIQQVDISKALRDDLTLRPVADTVADTLAWAKTRPDAYEMRAGLAPERERELLQAWRER
jgi:2'-hydroxyisoflavone reductase